MEATFEQGVIDPYEEAVAYECLYAEKGATLKSISEQTVGKKKLPSDVLNERLFWPLEQGEIEHLLDSKLGALRVAVDGTPQYPEKLHAANIRVPLLYYYGNINLVEAPSVSIVGSRDATECGRKRAAKLARCLAENKYTVVSGLARGIDTAALQSAITAGGKVVGVIGTPLDEQYPPENKRLQQLIGCEHLLISQVPFYHYAHQAFNSKKSYFRERNVTMGAISDATVIVEASDRSGSLIQANACIKQGRPLFIMRSLVENDTVSWPKRYLEKGAFVLDSMDDIYKVLER
jgi:DNA processing protein